MNTTRLKKFLMYHNNFMVNSCCTTPVDLRYVEMR